MPRKKPQASQREAQNKVRIIGGKWRGRLLPFPSVEGLRPTGNRLRETLFNWLAPNISGSRCLDLFAGSGAMGFEAASRGAASVTMVELSKTAATQLISNQHLLKAQQVTVVQADALGWLGNCSNEQFDILFLDPPFAANLWQPTLDAVVAADLLAPNGLVYLECPADLTVVAPASWTLHRDKTGGTVRYQLWHKIEAAE